MIEEVMAEAGLMRDVLAKISSELTKVAKTAVQRLKQDPESIKEYVFRAQDSIQALLQAAKLQPQETNMKVEESKGESKPKLVIMVDSFIEINHLIKNSWSKRSRAFM